jgi:hypothetical protein
MAKEKEKEVTLIDAFKDFKEEKSIDRPVMLGVLKDVFPPSWPKPTAAPTTLTSLSTWTKATARFTRTLRWWKRWKTL